MLAHQGKELGELETEATSAEARMSGPRAQVGASAQAEAAGEAAQQAGVRARAKAMQEKALFGGLDPSAGSEEPPAFWSPVP